MGISVTTYFLVVVFVRSQKRIKTLHVSLRTNNLGITTSVYIVTEYISSASNNIIPNMKITNIGLYFFEKGFNELYVLIFIVCSSFALMHLPCSPIFLRSAF